MSRKNNLAIALDENSDDAALLDTSLIVRYLTDDIPDQAARVETLLDSDQTFLLTDVVLIETGYVLQSVYGIARADVVDLLLALVQKQNIQVYQRDKTHIVAALLLCKPSQRVSYGDAMIWAAARQAGDAQRPATICTFDENFPEDGIRVRRDF